MTDKWEKLKSWARTAAGTLPIPVRRILAIVSTIAVLAGVILLIRAGYSYSWTGFGEYTSPPKSSGQDFQRAKTLWDWMDLLIIPIALAGGALWFNWAQKNREQAMADQRAQTERDIASENWRETTLQAYLDRMSELLLKENLHTSEPGSEVRVIAHARTLTVLRGLDGNRKGTLLWFLYAADLIIGDPGIINLARADLSGANLTRVHLSKANLGNADLRGANLSDTNLSWADLSGANLSGANLTGAELARVSLSGTNPSEANLMWATLSHAAMSGTNLSRATLSWTYLSGADLSGADLSGANLTRADLSGAKLIGADLSGTDLSGAKLSGADLGGANLNGADRGGANLTRANLGGVNLSGANLSGANLREARYDSNTAWPEGFDPAAAGAILTEG